MLTRHLRYNWGSYLVVLLALAAGVVVGAMKSPLTVEADLAGKLLSHLTVSTSGLSWAECLINQVPWWLLLGILGLTVVGVLLVIPLIFFKGYCVGFTLYTLARADSDTGMGFALAAVIPHNLIYIPCLLIMAVAAIKFTGILFSPERNGSVLIRNLFSYLLIMVLAGGGIALGALVESRVTPWFLHWW